MRITVLICIVLALTACGPEMVIQPIPDKLAQQSGTVQFLTTADKQEISEIHIQFFPKYQPTKISDITDTIQQNPNSPVLYQATLPKLAADDYRIIARMTYYWRIGDIKLVRFTRVIHSDFRVHPELSTECFRFDDKQKDVMGWTTTPVYLSSREEPISDSSCHGLFFANNSWPNALTETSGGGSLFIPVSNKCFPTSASNISEPGYWHFTLKSPNLSDREAWQKIRALEFRLATNTINVDVVPQVSYRLPNGKSEATPASPSYRSYVGNWRILQHSLNLPKGAIVTQLHLHIYGIPEHTVSDKIDSILLDGICPQH